jgi:hypothetical protein
LDVAIVTAVGIVGFVICACAAVRAIKCGFCSKSFAVTSHVCVVVVVVHICSARDESLLSHLNGNFTNDYDREHEQREYERIAMRFATNSGSKSARYNDNDDDDDDDDGDDGGKSENGRSNDRQPLLSVPSRQSALPSLAAAAALIEPNAANDF